MKKADNNDPISFQHSGYAYHYTEKSNRRNDYGANTKQK